MQNAAQETNLPGKKIYYGKPENQRDSRAVRSNPPAKPKSGAVKTDNNNVRRVPATIPPPKHISKNVGGTVTTGHPADASLFSPGVSVRENVPRPTFDVSAPAIIEIAQQMYLDIVTDDPSLNKILLPEYISYYATALLWFRILSLKERNSQTLTVLEQDVLRAVQHTTFNVPEPLILQIRTIGNLITKTGQHLYPSAPPLPDQQIGGIGGFFGPLVMPGQPNADNMRHNLYEELPTLGVTAAAIMASVSNAPPGAYISQLTLNGQQPNGNLLGFRPLAHRREEAKNIALNLGITDQVFPSHTPEIALNIELLLAVSNQLSDTKTFRVTPTVFSTLADSGGQNQLVITRPQHVPGIHTLAVRGEMLPSCLTKESESVFGAGIFFSSQLYKEPNGADHTNWSLYAQIPVAWIENRNVRRNLPNHFVSDTFSAMPQQASTFRQGIIKSLVLLPR